MYKGKTFLCVIPARAGSTRIPNKNMRLMNGKPLIYWAIKAAKESGVFDDIVVLSDSVEIRNYATWQGVYSYSEPPELASNTAYVGDAFADFLDAYKKICSEMDYVQLIEPTAPLIRPTTIQCAADYLISKNADFVISVAESHVPSYVSKPLPKDYCLRGWFPENLITKRSQDLEPTYHVNGVIYVGKWHLFADEALRTYWQSKIYAYIMDKWDSIDINDKWDFEIAELILKNRKR